MQEHIDKFRAVLVAELDDLVQDLKEAEELYRARYGSGELSGFVLKENTAVLEYEIAGVSAVRAALRAADIPKESASLCDWFKDLSRATIARNGFPEGIEAMMARKCAKVLRYVREP
jgi:hypothetical protein